MKKTSNIKASCIQALRMISPQRPLMAVAHLPRTMRVGYANLVRLNQPDTGNCTLIKSLLGISAKSWRLLAITQKNAVTRYLF